MKKANLAVGILASIPVVAFILVVCAVGYFSKGRITRKALGGPRAVVEVDESTLRRGFIGIQYESASENDTARLEIEAGVMITSIVPGSPADKCGIAVGDCLVDVDGMTVASRDDLALLSADWLPDEVIELTVIRRGDGPPVKRIAECLLISFDELMELPSRTPVRP